jgi:protein-S-isoprenylcysteine O-methyltransferase Ste14
MNHQANQYVFRVLAQRILGILAFFVFSRWTYGVRSITYFAMYLVFAIVSLALLRGVSPSTLAAREKTPADTSAWDRAILAVYWVLAYFAVYFFAGLESAGAPATVGWVFGIGIVLFLASFLLTLWAVRVNPFLESVSHIDRDRCPNVCNSGPYNVIRYPSYAAILIWCIAVAMVFETKYTAICAGLIAVVVIIRTALEDHMLLNGLDGYKEYTEKVKYRLIPFIW